MPTNPGVERRAVLITVVQYEAVFLVRADNGENRFNRHSIDEWHSTLDEIEKHDGPLALVTTGSGKFYSNGLDLDWMLGEGASDTKLLDDVHRLLVRILEFPAITVAAVNGHAYAAGAMLATAHDFVVMREDRGYWCLPEVDLGLPLTATMFHVVAAHLPRSTLRDSLLTGRRFTGPEALSAGIVHELAPESDVVSRAMERASALAPKDRQVVIAHKQMLNQATATS
jgi:enoyl-CoA hydratase/carnithine racemase